MKTPEEIKKGLAEAPHVKYIVDDPYRDDVHYEKYGVAIGYMLRDQIYIYITELEARLAQVELERDAAVADLSDSCRHCRFVKEEQDDSHCVDCFQRDGKNPWSPMVRTKFEWRGVCPENTKEENR